MSSVNRKFLPVESNTPVLTPKLVAAFKRLAAMRDGEGGFSPETTADRALFNQYLDDAIFHELFESYDYGENDRAAAYAVLQDQLAPARPSGRGRRKNFRSRAVLPARHANHPGGTVEDKVYAILGPQCIRIRQRLGLW